MTEFAATDDDVIWRPRCDAWSDPETSDLKPGGPVGCGQYPLPWRA